MKLHGNARTSPHSRLLMVRRVEEEGCTLAQAAEAAGVRVRIGAVETLERAPVDRELVRGTPA
jgi:hypothetical protein